MSGVLNGVWTISDADEGRRKEEEGKELIVVRGFMPQTVHFKDLPVVEKTPQQIQQEEKMAKRQAEYEAKRKANKQRSIAEILADDDDFEDTADEIKEEIGQVIDEIKEEAAEAVAEVKEELAEIREKIIAEE